MFWCSDEDDGNKKKVLEIDKRRGTTKKGKKGKKEKKQDNDTKDEKEEE